MDQLAGHYGAKTTSGSFRNKVTSARIFGLIEVTRKGIELTELGDRILVDRTSAQAKVDAFLNVPLYQKLYETFKGRTLPANKSGLESAILDAGVAPKQVATARWRFQSSAEVAGFFDHGKDRLVLPSLQPNEEPAPDQGESDDQGGGAADTGGLTDAKPSANLRSVTLRSGGTVTLGLSVDLFSLDETDQAFVLDLVKKVREYGAQKALPSASPESPDESVQVVGLENNAT